MAKTQAEINKRLDAYAKGTVDSPYRVKKATSYDPSFGVMEAGAIDVDKYYHAQCQDLITDYVLWLTDNKVRTWGNAKDQIKQSYGTGFKIHQNKPSTVPKKGWIAVFTGGSYSQWGHIGIVYDGGNTSTFTILEQNWNGYANKKPTKRVDNYYGLTHFIEIPVKAGTTVKKETAKKSASKTPAPKKKATLKVSKNHINYTMSKRGKKPEGMVIHNDAGRSSGQQYENSLAKAGYARYANGIAHYYGSEGYIWEAIDAKNQIAWHTGDGTGANSGNFRFAGIEVCQSMSASDAQFLKNEQAVFQFTAEKFKEWGLTPNRKTVRLHMEFVPTACPHRSMVLHTGFNPVTQGRPSKAIMNKLKDYFIKQIKNYMNNGTSSSTVVKKGKTSSASTPATRPVTGSWKKNQYGTWYKPESATFINGNQPIVTRIGSPFLNAPVGGNLPAGATIVYDEVCIQAGHIWIGYNAYNGNRVYCPVRTCQGVPPNQVPGVAWGTFK